MRYLPVIAFGRVLKALIKLVRPQGGSAIPGLVVNRIAPNFLRRTLSQLRYGSVMITGSSGKSTVTKVLSSLLSNSGLSVFVNRSTSNMLQGLSSDLLDSVSFTGKLRSDIAVLELDEAYAAELASALSPRVTVLLNVSVDQVDRFFDTSLVAEMLAETTKFTSEIIVLNADDPVIAALAEHLPPDLRVVWFGTAPGVTDKRYSPFLGDSSAVSGDVVRVESLSQDATSAELDVDFFDHTGTVTIPLPSPGVHNAMNSAAAVSAFLSLQPQTPLGEIESAFSRIEPVYGRGHSVQYEGQTLEFILVQNPASYQLNIDLLAGRSVQIFLGIGDDVRDPAYLWNTNLGVMPPVSIVSGSKAHHTALQLAYSGVLAELIEPDVPTALDIFLGLPNLPGTEKVLIFSADVFRKIKQYLPKIDTSPVNTI